MGYRCNSGRPAPVRSLWCEPLGEGIPASLFRELSFVRTPSQTAHTNCKGTELASILFPLFPHFKLHPWFTYRYVFLQRCRNPFGGPALLATFHDLLKWFGELTINRIYRINSNQIRQPGNSPTLREGGLRANLPFTPRLDRVSSCRSAIAMVFGRATLCGAANRSAGSSGFRTAFIVDGGLEAAALWIRRSRRG